MNKLSKDNFVKLLLKKSKIFDCIIYEIFS